MAFEFFTKTRHDSQPLTTIYKTGYIGLNKSAIESFGIPKGQMVLLGFDKDTKTVAIKLIDSPCHGARKIGVSLSDNMIIQGTINAKGFWQNFMPNFPVGQKYLLEKDSNGLLCFCLNRKFEFEV